MENNMLNVGDEAPNFCLFNEANQEVSLENFKGQKVILYFYPKDDTPGCTKESCDFRDAFKDLQSKNMVILGISKDTIKSHGSFKAKYSLPFSLLSDTDHKTLKGYGVLKEKSMFGKKYLGIERTTFIIDEQGKILKIFPNVKVLGHVKEILKLYS